MKRAVSALLAATLISVVALSMFTSLYILSQKRASTSIAGLDKLVDYVHQHEVTRLAVIVSGEVAKLRNLGSKPVELEYLVVLEENGVRVSKLPDGDLCRNLGVDGECLYNIGRGDLVAVITKSGVLIFPERIELEALPREAALVIPVVFPFKNLGDLGAEFNVSPELIAKPYPGAGIGMRGSNVLKLDKGDEYYNEYVSTEPEDLGISFGVLVVGYDPSWIEERATNPALPPRFSVMIAGPRIGGREKLRVDKEALPLAALGFRVKISNFTGTIKVLSGGGLIACSSSSPDVCGNVRSAIGVWYYGTELEWRVSIQGFFGYLAYYQRVSSGVRRETSYEPYLFLGDIDENGVVDLVFITEDAYYGDETELNDAGEVDLTDYSTVPLKLVLLGVGRILGYPDGSIDGSRYSGVLLYINMVFHDNSYPDIKQELEDIWKVDWILRILLVDQRGNEYVVREYWYQEICRYHKTLVRDLGRDNYFTKLTQTVYVPIPSSGKYWIVIALQDPYYYEYYKERGVDYYRNDAEITVGVEIIGVIPLLR